MTVQTLVWIAWLVALFLLLLKLSIPWLDGITNYGKLLSNNNKRALFTRKSAFISGYWLATIWNLAFLIAYFCYHQYLGPKLFDIISICSLYQIHLFRRLYECQYVHILSREPMHLFNVILVWSYYAFAPLALHFDLLNSNNPETSYVLKWVALGLFVIGNIVQMHSHYILRRLRDEAKDTRSRQRYFIPKGGLFEYVSCPHYLGEILIYSSFLLFTNFTEVGPIMVFTFVSVTLISQALKAHRWYHFKFHEVYPAHRTAIVPYVL